MPVLGWRSGIKLSFKNQTGKLKIPFECLNYMLLFRSLGFVSGLKIESLRKSD